MRKPLRKWLAACVLLPVLTGCMSFSGYGGTDKFRCSNDFDGKASDDPYCGSITSNYGDSVAGLLSDGYRNSSEPATEKSVRTLMNTRGYDSGTPVRSQNEIARVWIAPFLDTDGDLIDQNFVYVVLNQGKWLIEHNQQNIVDEYRPVRLLGASTGSQSNVPVGNTNNESNGGSSDRVPDVGTTLNLNPLGGQSSGQ